MSQCKLSSAKVRQERQKVNHECPLTLTKVPERSFQIVGTNMFHLDKNNYLLIGDRISGYFNYF